MVVLRMWSASSSEVTFGVFLVLAYAGDNNAFAADLPDGHNVRYKGAQVAGLQERGGSTTHL
jgi:hypothetical protein